MREFLDLTYEIVRWVADDPQPGVVEARFTDAAGKTWVLIDKDVIFTSELISSRSAYPQPGGIRCEVLDRWRDPAGRTIVRIWTIDTPGTDGDVLEECEVQEAQLAPPAWDYAGSARSRANR